MTPNDHPRSVHNLDEWYYGDQTWPTHIIYQRKSDSIERHWRLTRQDRHLGLPVVNDEPAYQGEITRGGVIRALWAVTVAGGYASTSQKTASKKGPYFPDLDRPPTFWPNPRDPRGWTIRERAGLLHRLMTTRTEWWKMNTHTRGGDVYVRSEPGRQYLVLVPKGKTGTVDLSAAAGRNLPIVYLDIHTLEVKVANPTRGRKTLSVKAPADDRIYLIGGNNAGGNN